MIQENDFIEIEYTGRIKDDGIVFDTTDKNIAKENGLPEPNGHMVICVGQGQILEGLDKNLVNKEISKEYNILLQPEEAFGKKSAKFVQLVSTSKFKENNVMPQPGLQVNIDGVIGTIKTVSGGRTLVDFNHPLAGKTVIYEIKIMKKIEDTKDKLSSYLSASLGVKNLKVELNENKACVEFPAELQSEIKEHIVKKIKALIPEIKELEFKASTVK